MPSLQKQTQAVESELQSLKMAAVDEAKYLQLAESLAGFRSKLRVRAEVLDIAVRQQILRLLVKEVLLGSDTITLRHSIPTPQSGPGSNGSPAPPAGVTGSKPSPGYLLRSGSHDSALRRATTASLPTTDPPFAVLIPFRDWNLQPHPDQTPHVPIDYPPSYTLQQFGVWNGIKVLRQIGVHHIGVAVTK